MIYLDKGFENELCLRTLGHIEGCRAGPEANPKTGRYARNHCPAAVPGSGTLCGDRAIRDTERRSDGPAAARVGC
jgi:hypothetical protein